MPEREFNRLIETVKALYLRTVQWPIADEDFDSLSRDVQLFVDLEIAPRVRDSTYVYTDLIATRMESAIHIPIVWSGWPQARIAQELQLCDFVVLHCEMQFDNRWYDRGVTEKFQKRFESKLQAIRNNRWFLAESSPWTYDYMIQIRRRLVREIEDLGVVVRADAMPRADVDVQLQYEDYKRTEHCAHDSLFQFLQTACAMR